MKYRWKKVKKSLKRKFNNKKEMSLRGSPNPKYQKNKSSLTIKTTKTNNENNHTERRRKIFHLGA